MRDALSRRNTGYSRMVRQSGDWTTRTYYLTAELVSRLDAVAMRHKVGVSDLVRYLLADGLTRVEHGELEIPTKDPNLLLIDQ
jgi:hypothetical protein